MIVRLVLEGMKLNSGAGQRIKTGLVPFVTQLTRVTTAARPCSSVSCLRAHQRGHGAEERDSEDQQGEKGINVLWSKCGV